MWTFFHAYNRLVSEGKVKPLTCPDDGFTLVTTLEPDDETDSVNLWCPGCNTTIRPGLSVVEQVKAVVKEHLMR